MGGEHSALLNECNGTAARRKQCKLWKIGGSANNPAEWWAFPDAGSVLEGITLPPELVGYTLDGLTLNVRVRSRKSRTKTPSPSPHAHLCYVHAMSQVCDSHETHIKGPGGVKNSAKLRVEPELAYLNGKSASAVESRKALARRLDQLVRVPRSYTSLSYTYLSYTYLSYILQTRCSSTRYASHPTARVPRRASR